MKLTEHFTLEEMIATKTGLPNNPGPKELDALRELCIHALEPIREYFGRPVIVLSGYRSPQVNSAVGGARTSQHLKGEAADIYIPGVKNSDLWAWIVNNLTFDQVIAEQLHKDNGAKGWVHVSYKKDRYRMDAISFLGRGRYVKGLAFV